MNAGPPRNGTLLSEDTVPLAIRLQKKPARALSLCRCYAAIKPGPAPPRAVRVGVKGIALGVSAARIAARSRIGSMCQLCLWDVHPTEANVRVGHAGRTDGLSFQMSVRDGLTGAPEFMHGCANKWATTMMARLRPRLAPSR